MKLNIGCGVWRPAGYVTYDLYDATADVQGDARKLPYEDGSIEEILASHLLEHFDFKEAFAVLTEWKRVLCHGGKLILEVPNLENICRKFADDPSSRVNLYIQIFGAPWYPGHGHLFGYAPEQLLWTLQTVGFKDIIRMPPQRYLELGDLCMRYECLK
jgi:ubiquinone/menaquinone biosynthesis C-methylase UbiE